MNFDVVPCPVREVRDFIEQHHYSHNINGLKVAHCFKLLDGSHLIGAILYGGLAMAGQWKKYVDQESDIVELRRLVCVDDTPRNTESYFIGASLRWLKRHTNIKKVLSYADTNQGHVGIVYRASNWQLVGMTSPGRIIKWGERTYHDKTIRTKYNGALKPYAQRVKDALDSKEAYYIKQLPKYTYLYDLESRR